MGGLLDHIGPACKEAREQANLAPAEMAAALRTAQANISRFENRTRGPHPKRIDELVAGYAQETGRTELQIWLRAIEMWQNAST